ncbi:MAG TPA: alpha/beta hydrolase [Pseudolabrys sp.]|nr:alpha/beta hydrolase [Pseudolabrys sp.]
MLDATADCDFLILPGLGNSGVDHWQSYWCLSFRNATRVLQDDWEAPVLSDWLARLDAAIENGTRPAVLICHSLSCSLAAHWASRNKPSRVVAALLVAPTDVENRMHLPENILGFDPMPLARFPVPALAVTSSNDPYVSVARAQRFAEGWGADFCNAGELGHINSASRLEFWPQGLLLLGQLLARIGR